MIKLDTNPANLSEVRAMFQDRLQISDPEFVATYISDAMRRKVEKLISTIDGPWYEGELEAYILAPLISTTQWCYSSSTVKKNFVSGVLSTRAAGYSLIHEYITLSQARTVALEMQVSLVQNSPIYKALSNLASPPQPKQGKGKGSQDDIYSTLQAWMSTSPNLTTATRGQGWPNAISTYEPDRSQLLYLAGQYLSGVWDDSSGAVTDITTALSVNLNDLYSVLLENTGTGKGFALSKAKRKHRIDELYSIYYMICGIGDQAEGDLMTDERWLNHITLLYWFILYLQAKLSDEDMFPKLQFQVNSVAWAQTIRSISRKLSDLYTSISLVPLNLQIHYIQMEWEDSLNFVEPFLRAQIWVDEIKKAYQEATHDCESFANSAISNLVQAARDAYKAHFDGAHIVSGAIASKWWNDKGLLAFQKATSQLTPLSIMSAGTDLYSMMSSLLYASRDVIATQLAEAASSLRSTGYYVSNHIAILSLAQTEEVQLPAPPEIAEVDANTQGSITAPQVCNFTRSAKTSVLTRLWVNDYTNTIRTARWTLEKEARTLQPMRLTTLRSKEIIGLGENDVKMPYWRSVANVPVAAVLTRDYFNQPVPYPYVASWSRRKKKWNVRHFLEMMQYDTTDRLHGLEDKLRLAARLAMQTTTGFATSIVDAMAAVGTWWISDDDYTEGLAVVEKANQGYSKEGVSPDATVFSGAINSVMWTFGSIGSVVSDDPEEDGGTLEIDPNAKWTALMPTVPAIYGCPTRAMIEMNIPRDKEVMKDKAIAFKLTDPNTGSMKTMIFILHRIIPRLSDYVLFPWQAPSKTIIATSVWTSIVRALFQSKYVDSDVASDGVAQLWNATNISHLMSDVRNMGLGKISQLLKMKSDADPFSVNEKEILDLLPADRVEAPCPVSPDSVSQLFTRFEWASPNSLTLPHITIDTQVVDPDLLADQVIKTNYALMRRIDPVTQDLQMRMFFSDEVVLMDRSDLIAAEGLSDPVITGEAVGNKEDAPSIEGAPGVPVGASQAPTPGAATLTPTNQVQVAESRPAGAVSISPESGKTTQELQSVARGSNGATNTEAKVTQAVSITDGAGIEKSAEAAHENRTEKSEGQPAVVKGDPKEAKPEDQGTAPGQQAAVASKKKSFYANDKGEVIELGEGDTVPSGYKPISEDEAKKLKLKKLDSPDQRADSDTNDNV